MKVLITGACGFVGRTICEQLTRAGGYQVYGVDSLARAGSEGNRAVLRGMGVKLIHGDIRVASDVEGFPEVDWVIDAAANPSVLAGTRGDVSSRQLMEHNLVGTIQLLEYCKRVKAGLCLLSTSRVYAIDPLAALPIETVNEAFRPRVDEAPDGVSEQGIAESFPSGAPMSLYGATKHCSEVLALEYGSTFDFPVWVNRCGVLAGAGQFAVAEQGIFSFWIHRWVRGAPLRYIGFDGRGHQVRDCLHPSDLARLVAQQLGERDCAARPQVVNVSGGAASACSLAQLSRWCGENLGAHEVHEDGEPRPFDLPWVVLDNREAASVWDWTPELGLHDVLDEIAGHARANPGWLEMTGGI